MRSLTILAIGAALALTWTADAFAQRGSSIPSRGACFYEDASFRGDYFCFPLGATIGVIPIETNDRISSIRLFGPVEVIVYKDGQFRGASRRFTSSISNLGTTGWNDRISSFRVEQRNTDGGSWGGGYGGSGWGGGHGGSGWGGGYGGACGGGSHGGWGSSGGGRWTYQEARQMVSSAYRSVLRRDPDPSGWNFWTNEVMKRNLTRAQLEAELRDSDEYRERRR